MYKKNLIHRLINECARRNLDKILGLKKDRRTERDFFVRCRRTYIPKINNRFSPKVLKKQKKNIFLGHPINNKKKRIKIP